MNTRLLLASKSRFHTCTIASPHLPVVIASGTRAQMHVTLLLYKNSILINYSARVKEAF